MRVGCLQFASRPGEVETNMKKAHDILDKVGKQTSTAVESNLDFLVLPKVAFSGPDFKPEDLGKYETTTTSTQLWAKSAAVKYGCTVVVGYPEVIDARCGQIPEERWFSSSIAIDKFGKTVENDAERIINTNEPMFSDIKTDFGKITVGQFTDLGEREFSNDLETTAFAEHMLAVDSYAAIISMAWAKEDPDFSSKPPYKPDEYALSCWVARLEPLVEAKRKEETLIVLCNSTGPDTYAGTSAVLGIKDGEVLVYDYLGSSQEGLLVVDTSKNPVHKLSPRRMEAGPNLEQDTESLTSADSPQTGPLTPDTSYRGSDTAQEFPHEYDFDAEGAKRLALPAVRVFPTLVTVGRPATGRGQARPKLDIPKLNSKIPREISATEYIVRAAAASDPKDSSAKVRSPEASTPYPGSRQCLANAAENTTSSSFSLATFLRPYVGIGSGQRSRNRSQNNQETGISQVAQCPEAGSTEATDRSRRLWYHSNSCESEHHDDKSIHRTQPVRGQRPPSKGERAVGREQSQLVEGLDASWAASS
ncbi:carbon-nitrogen hydrolase [Beauveria bassiana ARSEF 2860]|uniref:Carbon-nitrogen hydrolase n=1 Tax=Beauveria bassiana (strain ARSEF 2860) TaxID=655819 RepID=J5K3K7_BEAB2|nr:carbon-nitrogen hydrolase [Beauveria bassiana ARSEF 2860]EJP68651.1 carbon-nitrogen hydrolase [Beauveria bassiana ARSEF 2860]